MSKLDDILKELAKEIKADIARDVRAEMREIIVSDVKAIVKEEINKDQVYQNSGNGLITVSALSEKYKISKVTIYKKCRIFNVERKQVGKQKLVNEAQFLAACQEPMSHLSFLKKEN